MKQFKLSKSMSLGYAPIDDEHHLLVSMINKLASLPEDASLQEIERHFKAILHAFEEHCISETKILSELGFPEAEAQGRHHDELVARMKDIGAGLSGEDGRKKMRKDCFLETLWVFVEEAVKEDLQAKSFLIEQGVVETV